MRDTRGDCSPAAGIVVGVVASAAMIAGIAAWGEAALRYAAWVVMTMVEAMR